MSTEIDWSKAPEGATHWGPETEDYYEAWYKNTGEKWYCATKSTNWNWLVDNELEPYRFQEMIDRPYAWNGEDLQPVGTVCEWLDPNSKRWLPVEIVFSSSWVLVLRDTNPHPDGPVDLAIDLTSDKPELRPFRTPEQIAAEEREAAIADIFEVLTGHRNQAAWSNSCYSVHAENLYDAGYRKVMP